MAKNSLTIQKYDMFLIIANCFVFFLIVFLPCGKIVVSLQPNY